MDHEGLLGAMPDIPPGCVPDNSHRLGERISHQLEGMIVAYEGRSVILALITGMDIARRYPNIIDRVTKGYVGANFATDDGTLTVDEFIAVMHAVNDLTVLGVTPTDPEAYFNDIRAQARRDSDALPN